MRHPNKDSGFRFAIECSAVFMLFGCGSPVKQDSKKPNILFIVADDLGWADLKCYGADLHETPNIDKLAARSVMFLNSYAAAPVCSPTRASLMTGLYPARLNFTIWSEAASVSERKNQEIYKYLPPQTLENLPLEEVTIAEKLKENGYLTAHIGKWHLGDLMHFPETQGFDVSVAASQRGAPPTYFYPYKGEAFGELRFVGNLGTSSKGKYFTDRKGEYLTDRLTDEAMKMISDAGSRPFYLNLWYYNVHTPLEAKAEDTEYFRKKLSPGFHHQNETYAAMVKSVDDNVGRLMKKLDELGIADNTVVIFISDNGGYINEYKNKTVTSNFPLRSGKGSLYEGGIRIPTIIFLPNNPQNGKKIETPVSTIDFYPTLLDITGTVNNIPVDGKSILPLLKGNADTSLQNRTLYWHYPHYYPTTTPVSAIRDGKWKLMEYLEDGHTELYNLDADPGETRNLVNEEQKKAGVLLENLQNWKKSVDARRIVPNPNYRQ
jgi:arylsulfatase A